jgi:hypothetical protein
LCFKNSGKPKFNGVIWELSSLKFAFLKDNFDFNVENGRRAGRDKAFKVLDRFEGIEAEGQQRPQNATVCGQRS